MRHNGAREWLLEYHQFAGYFSWIEQVGVKLVNIHRLLYEYMIPE